MKTTLFLVTLVVTFSFTGINAFGQQKASEVKISSVPFPFVWETPALSYKVLDKGISIVADKGTDLYTFVDGNYYTHTAPRLLFKPDKDFTFSVKIKPDFENLYDAGALLLYSDEENWAKIIFEVMHQNKLVIGSSVIRNKKTDDNYHTVINMKEPYVKVSKSGNVFCFYYSLDGKEWNLLRTFGYEKVENMRIGFYAQSPNGPNCTVEFLDIRYKGEGFKDFFTGE